MSADPLHALASAGKGESTRGLLRVIILALIAGASIASRLFSVIRTWPFLVMVQRVHLGTGLCLGARHHHSRGPGYSNCLAYLRLRLNGC